MIAQLTLAALLLAAPAPPEVPQSEVDYINEVVGIYFENIFPDSFAPACNVTFATAGDAVTGTCYASSGISVIVLLVVHSGIEVTIIPIGEHQYVDNAEMASPELTLTADAPLAPTP